MSLVANKSRLYILHLGKKRFLDYLKKVDLLYKFTMIKKKSYTNAVANKIAI